MLLSSRWIALICAFCISLISIAFLSFLPESNADVLFVGGISSFFATLIIVYYVIDILVFREVNKIYFTIKKLKNKNFDISKKSLIRSVNPLKKLNTEISNYFITKQEEIDELKKMETFRREFLADVSHELKTPIFAAQGFIHTLLDGAYEDPDVSQRFLNKAAKSLDGLDILVRDLVILTQVESGDLKMNYSVINLIEITENIFEQLEEKALARNVKLEIVTKRINKCLVWGDYQRITQVLTNLIDNAIKYGNANGEVKVEFVDHQNQIKVAIRDNGPGIAADQQIRIFERFYRIDRSRSRETGGTGLGLAIVKHILNAHHSTITVSSKINKGTSFTFFLSKPIKEND